MRDDLSVLHQGQRPFWIRDFGIGEKNGADLPSARELVARYRHGRRLQTWRYKTSVHIVSKINMLYFGTLEELAYE